MGRYEKIYPPLVISKIVEDYLLENPSIIIIEYKKIHEYSLSQFDLGKIEFELSYDYWRKEKRKGRILVDKVNKQRSYLRKSESDYIEIASTKDVIERLSNDSPAVKKMIINQLKINEKGFTNLTTKYKKLKDKEERLLTEVESLKKQLEILKENNGIYQNVLFQWADISSSRDINIINTITTGKTRTKVVEQLFTDIFSDDPNAAYKQINQQIKESNVVNLKDKKKNNLIVDLDL